MVLLQAPNSKRSQVRLINPKEAILDITLLDLDMEIVHLAHGESDFKKSGKMSLTAHFRTRLTTATVIGTD